VWPGRRGAVVVAGTLAEGVCERSLRLRLARAGGEIAQQRRGRPEVDALGGGREACGGELQNRDAVVAFLGFAAAAENVPVAFRRPVRASVGLVGQRQAPGRQDLHRDQVDGHGPGS
jgi:hypothetical protein